MENYTKRIKERVSRFLNGATAAVVRSYGCYLKNHLSKVPDESKESEDFKKFHDAGKSAASHLESLLKLTNATDDPAERQKEDERSRERRLQSAVEKGRAELGGGDNA
jgi:hypothetical protein